MKAHSDRRLWEQPLGLEDMQIRLAPTLQKLLDVSAEIFERHQIDHAVLFSLPEGQRASLFLPLGPFDETVKAATERAIQQGVHPAAAICCRSTGPTRVSTRSPKVAEHPFVEQLLAAFRKVDVRYFYEIPLAGDQGQLIVAEVARAGSQIGADELTELGVIAQEIFKMLPMFMRPEPQSESDDYEYHVR